MRKEPCISVREIHNMIAEHDALVLKSAWCTATWYPFFQKSRAGSTRVETVGKHWNARWTLQNKTQNAEFTRKSGSTRKNRVLIKKSAWTAAEWEWARRKATWRAQLSKEHCISVWHLHQNSCEQCLGFEELKRDLKSKEHCISIDETYTTTAVSDALNQTSQKETHIWGKSTYLYGQER